MSQKKNRKKSDIYPGTGQLCCHCGSPAVLRPASEVCRTHRKGAMAYVCAKYPACDSYVMACPGTLRPMGSLAGPELRRLRRQAHLSFNRLYETGLMSKRKAYEWLSYITQSPMSHAHIGHLGDYYCRVVIQESGKKLAEFQAASAGRRSAGILHSPNSTRSIGRSSLLQRLFCACRAASVKWRRSWAFPIQP